MAFFSVFALLLLFGSTLCVEQPPTKAPSKRYPVRTFLGNMYHRLRNNRLQNSMFIIPPLLRLAYQYGGPLLDKVMGGAQTGSAAASSAVESAIGSANAPIPAAIPFGPPFAPPMGFGGLGGPLGGSGPFFYRKRR